MSDPARHRDEHDRPEWVPASCCGAVHVFGIRRHKPGCPGYPARDMLAEHPDLVDLDLEMAWWYPGEEAA